MHRNTFKWCLILSCNICNKATVSKIWTVTIKLSTPFVNVQQPTVCKWHEWVRSRCCIRQIDSLSNTYSCAETDTDSTHSCVYYPLSHIMLHHTILQRTFHFIITVKHGVLKIGSVSSPLCVCKLERVCSQTQLCQLRCLMTILDNYMFRPLLAIFRLSSRELKVLLYIMCTHIIYSRTLSSLKDNLKMASRGRNM